MNLSCKTGLLLVSVFLLVGVVSAYSNKGNVELHRGEKLSLGDYSFEYDTVGGDRFEVSETRQGGRYLIEQVPLNELYGSKGETYDFPNEELSVVFEGMAWSDQGSYLNLTVSSSEDIFTDAVMTADVPRRVIAARGDEIDVPLTLENRGTKNTTYNLSKNVSEGLAVSYSYQGFNISSIEVPAGESFDLSARIEVLESAEVGNTEVVFEAESSKKTIEKVNVEVRGSEKTREIDFEIDQNYITTWPGKEFSISPEIRNTGEAPIENLEVELELPENWDRQRERQNSYEILQKYDNARPYYRIKVPGNAESGDYYVTVDPKSENLDIESERIRVHVRTKSGLSYVGIGLILLSLLGMAVTYLKLGRR